MICLNTLSLGKYDSAIAGRWRKAQVLELNFWSRWTEIPPYRNLDIPLYWRREVARFGVEWECFGGLRVLDLGCGPFGLIHYLDHAAERIRIDPLLPSYEQKAALHGPQMSVAAMGESLPLAERSIDLAICFNALDHMLDPRAALAEIARVLRPGGTALLMVHTFPGWLKPLYGFDRMHPHHFTATAFAALVAEHLQVEHTETIRRNFRSLNGGEGLPWKYAVGNLVVSSRYVRASLPTV